MSRASPSLIRNSAFQCPPWCHISLQKAPNAFPPRTVPTTPASCPTPWEPWHPPSSVSVTLGPTPPSTESLPSFTAGRGPEAAPRTPLGRATAGPPAASGRGAQGEAWEEADRRGEQRSWAAWPLWDTHPLAAAGPADPGVSGTAREAAPGDPSVPAGRDIRGIGGWPPGGLCQQWSCSWEWWAPVRR